MIRGSTSIAATITSSERKKTRSAIDSRSAPLSAGSSARVSVSGAS